MANYRYSVTIKKAARLLLAALCILSWATEEARTWMTMTVNADKAVFPALDANDSKAIDLLLNNFFRLEISNSGVVFIFVDWFGDRRGGIPTIGNRQALIAGDDDLAKQFRDIAQRLEKLLSDPSPRIRELAVALVSHLPTPIFREMMGKLSSTLHDSDVNVRVMASYHLAHDGSFDRRGNDEHVTPELIDSLRDSVLDSSVEISYYSISALGQIGPKAQPAIGNIIVILDGSDWQLLERALSALVAIGGETPSQAQTVNKHIPILLSNDHPKVRKEAARLAGALKTDDPQVVRAVTIAVTDMDSEVRGAATEALTAIAPIDDYVVEQLTARLRTVDAPLALNALREIAAKAAVNKDFKILSKLQAAQIATQIAKTDFDKDKLSRFLFSVQQLQNENDSIRRLTANFIKNNITYIWWVPLYIGWLSLVIILFLAKPIALLAVAKFIEPIEVQMPSWLGGLKIPTSYLLLVGILKHRNRVLDSWVEAKSSEAVRHFNSLPTVIARQVHVDIPLILDGRNIVSLSSIDIRSLFERKINLITIAGKGGVGKTSLACYLARSLLLRDTHGMGWKMLPIILEQESDFHHGSSFNLVATVGRQLQIMIDASEPLAADLVEKLLRAKRVLVVVDGISEMKAEIRTMFRPGDVNFPANALVVTTREPTREAMTGASRLEPLEVAGNRLASFMEAYLTAMGKRSLFDDTQFFEVCLRLSRLAGDKPISVMITKMFADYSVAAHSNEVSDDDIRCVPDIVVNYVNTLNNSIMEGRLTNEHVSRISGAVAWVCIAKTLSPGVASIKEVRSSTNIIEDIDIDYLEKRLRLIYRVPLVLDVLRFYLDPVAEYLAALHVLRGNFVENMNQIDARLREPGAVSFTNFLNILLETAYAVSSTDDVIERINLAMREVSHPDLRSQLNTRAHGKTVAAAAGDEAVISTRGDR